MADFKEVLQQALDECGLKAPLSTIDNLCRYYELLIEWNARMNLTALTESREVAIKHFCDSLSVLQYVTIPEGASLIDVGTGAGFPGMVLKLMRPDIRLTLLDSLKKRLVFLDEVCRATGAEEVQIIHARAEDAARTELREQYDVAISRAVARLNTLCEYCVPYVKPGGVFIAMKSKDADIELDEAQNAIRVLSCKAEANHSFLLADAGQRNIITIRKTAVTDVRYPRAAKKIKNQPL